MNEAAPSDPDDVRKLLRQRLEGLRERGDKVKKRIERGQAELSAIEKDIAELDVQLSLLTAEIRRRPIAGLGKKLTRKNTEFQQVWLFIQIAFKGSDRGWHRPEPGRGLTQEQLYKELQFRGGAPKEVTFRSYLHRLKKADLIWKHKGKWHLTATALAAGEPRERGEKSEE